MKKFRLQDSIIFENTDYLIINKPAGISTLDDRNDPTNILQLAKSQFDNILICHRLDKDTSGVLVLAKNEDAHRHLSMLFEDRKVQKVYHAVADGIHEFSNKVVDLPIKVSAKGIVKVDKRAGKASKTTFNSLEAFKLHTLIECKPETGRMHQIRIHLAESNAPITGDLSYGGRHFYLSTVKRNYNLKKWTEEEPLIKRMALHAFSIGFTDKNGKIITAEAAYPKDFRVLVEQLGKNK